jgi:hypothetical protein
LNENKKPGLSFDDFDVERAILNSFDDSSFSDFG